MRSWFAIGLVLSLVVSAMAQEAPDGKVRSAILDNPLDFDSAPVLPEVAAPSASDMEPATATGRSTFALARAALAMFTAWLLRLST